MHVIYPVEWKKGDFETCHYHLISSLSGATHPTTTQSGGQLNYCDWLSCLEPVREETKQSGLKRSQNLPSSIDSRDLDHC